MELLHWNKRAQGSMYKDIKLNVLALIVSTKVRYEN